MDDILQIGSEENYKDLFDSAHDLIHIVHPDGRIMYANRSWTQLLGYAPEDIIGTSIYSLVDPAERKDFENYRRRIIRGEDRERETVVTFLSRDGKKLVLEGFVTAREKDGVPLYTRGIFRDITLRLEQEAQLKRYTEELREREVNLHRLLTNAPDAVIVIDQQSNILFWNVKAEEFFGWKSEEVIGQSLTNKIVPVQYRQAHDAGMKRYLATGETHVLNRTVEITAINKAGNEFFISLTISTTQQNNNIAFIAFIRDISEQKKNQLELEQKTRELEQSNQKLEQFAHVASHDMKEPIRKVKLFNELLREQYGKLLPEVANTYLAKVQKAANRLLNMVEGVLKYASVEKDVDTPEPIDLQSVLDNIVADLEIVIRDKNARIEYSNLPQFEGMPFLVYQLFYNLVNNALKFTRADVQPLISIDGKKIQEQGRNMIQLIIEDNGIGFAQQHAERIFESFTRLNPKDQYEGTGLGLALCREIVLRHKGTITAEGKPGEGARFIILLPESL